MHGEDRHDGGMRQRRIGTRLTQEPLAQVGVQGERLLQHLDGDIPLEGTVQCEIDRADCTAPQHPHHRVVVRQCFGHPGQLAREATIGIGRGE